MTVLTAKQKEVIRKIIYAVETGGQEYGKQNYKSIIGAGTNTDNEKAITIGAGQWYATEALQLLRLIMINGKATFDRLDTAGIADDMGSKDWSTYNISMKSNKAKCIVAIIGSDIGIECQDMLMERQITKYSESIQKKYGDMSADAIAECINIKHQGGDGALKRILAKTARPYTAKTIYAALNTDPADKSNNNQVGDYVSRQKKVYEMINKHLITESEVTQMGYYRNEVVNLANSWVGRNEANGTHKYIIDIYNGHSPLPRGTKMQYNWAWCACTWSALAIKLGYTAIMPIEISCFYIIEEAKKMNIWQENDGYIPNIGDAILYDWDDSGSGDNKGNPDHIGTVVYVNRDSGYMVVVEGNYSNAVKKRTIMINGRFIRGFICPKYSGDGAAKPSTPVQSGGKDIATVAREVIAGQWGNGDARKKNLKAAGYNYNKVQAKVNEILNGGAAKPSTTTQPQEQPTSKKVIAGAYADKFNKSLAGTYKTTANLYMRHGAGTNKKSMVVIPNGTKVKCYGYYSISNGVKWLYIQVTIDGVQYTGFSSSAYLKRV